MNLPTETFIEQSVVANKGEERKMNRSLSILTGIILSATLIGCSSSDEVDQMQQLTNKVDMLSDQVAHYKANKIKWLVQLTMLVRHQTLLTKKLCAQTSVSTILLVLTASKTKEWRIIAPLFYFIHTPTTSKKLYPFPLTVFICCFGNPD